MLLCFVAGGGACHSSPAPAPKPARNLVGLRFPPLPAGHRDVGGLVINSPDSVMYSLAHVTNKQRSMLWLSRLTGHDSLGQAYWQVRSVLSLPKLRSKESLVTADCSLDGVADASIVAIGQWTKQDTVAAIRYAWRPDVVKERFDTLAPKRVACGFTEDRH